ncbi:MAG: efflux RND transporter permease subunit [Gammaproteobacteria bacterium]|jgi:CzcA family heavy metal efflux pump|nr:efflux RND transporter permease subunit [Gammaproteobacteria bacterium]MBK7727355.1 efflux RND transporter permease subunit [Gammaproteobacteria bacterium]MBK9664811.1 efflux RND transporter permease subunit [Gammaproteobacteria bacterium]MBP6050245.1 efflux RND transporter permease subunit [Pseudomonadales bacterium]MBP6228647.1 efflux RND transporter permease subunit [Pseudomonadales bacterium]
MWIVRLALQRPYTFIVLALLLPLIGALSIFGSPMRAGMPTDIFPDIPIPVIGVVFAYSGLAPDEMAGRITTTFERPLTTIVNDVEHLESQSYPGIAVIKVFFQPGVDINLAMSQITAFAQTSQHALPPGTSPPFVMKYSASTVPIIQLAFSSAVLGESELFDLANQFVRAQLATVAGASVPFPYGGAARQINVDLDPVALRAQGLSPRDVNQALGDQNLVLPAGTQKIGTIEYAVKLNASPQKLEELNDLPIRGQNGSITYVRDVAHVHDGHPPQTNIVRVDGSRAVLMTVQKTGSASTLDIIETIKQRLPQIRALLPDDVNLEATGDQSVFVKASIQGVLAEGLIAALLTALLILLFLGSWHSTLIIAISIPLSILCSIIALHALGETINIMTLGGLALAVGILVDDGTVTIENINRLLEEGRDVEEAILEGSRQILVPALVSTLSICIVFVPMFLLTGVARYLFVPMAEAVVFAMLASYGLSRTLVPTLAKYWLRPRAVAGVQPPAHPLRRVQQAFERRFEALRTAYFEALQHVMQHRGLFVCMFLGFALLSMLLYPALGRNFFPQIDSGQIRLHMRGPSGTRVEETALLADDVEEEIRRVIPAADIASVVDIVGLPNSGINLTYGTSGTIGTSDADILIRLEKDHRPTADYVRELRRRLPEAFPSINFAFLPADIVSQILNFGLPAPINLQIIGPSGENRALARQLLAELRHVPGLVDLRIQQENDKPEFRVSADRGRAEQLGLTQRDLAGNLLIALSGSFQTSPTYWLNPANGVQYPIVTRMPQNRVSSLDDLQNLPVGSAIDGSQQILGALASISRGAGANVATHYDAQPVIDIFGSVQDRDLGGVAQDVDRIVAAYADKLPRGTRLVARGQMETMRSSFTGLLIGLAGAIVLVYLLIVVNFQSWTDPFVIISALPVALAGIAWMLFLSGTTLSVPALTGAIMCMGVATANSILVVSFARERIGQGLASSEAALEAGHTRFRPVLMTALAMIIGMLPMALGLGEGGEQNAPLGRAVIGGLIFATFATLFFVPGVFSLLHRARNDASAV